MLGNDLIERRILPVAVQRCAESPVVLLEGPRTVGKSTLLRALAAQLGGSVLDLDDVEVREAVLRDPATMLSGNRPILIDEYQHAPVVLDVIKTRLNRSSSAGQFVLTGSTRHESLPRAAQSLTGRLQRLAVLPLTQVEIEGNGTSLLTDLLVDHQGIVTPDPSETTRGDYIERIVRGGLPLALAARSGPTRGRWIDSYVRLTLERDVMELSRIREAHALPMVLGRLASQTAQVYSGRALANGMSIDEKTVRDYVRLLESVFLVRMLPAWDPTLTGRTTSTPKSHVIDSAVAAHLLRMTPEKLMRRDPAVLTQFGHLLESFVVGELLAQASWSEELTTAGHWRTRDSIEVDLVLETYDGRTVAFEVKAASRVSGSDYSGLRRLRERLGESFVAGAVLHTGARSYTMEDRLLALPIDRLWTKTSFSGDPT